MSNDNTNEIDEVEPVEHECAITGGTFLEEDMTQVPASSMDNFNLSRRNHLMSQGRTEEAERFLLPRYVWVCDEGRVGYCSDCGGIYDTDDWDCILSLEVCGNCSSGYEYCENHDVHHSTSEGCIYCDEESEQSNRFVHDYSYRPAPLFHIMTPNGSNVVSREPRNVAVTGFELEMESSDCCVTEGAELANSLYDHVSYLKHDGSLNDGFEMVTHPMTLEYINTKFNFGGLRELAELGMRSASTSTCGLHVHINKGYFKNRATSLYRFMSLFYRNPEMWQKIAGRTRSSYAQWDIGQTENMLAYVKSLKANEGRGAYNYDRYVAINLQPTNTIELRFFKGTLRAESLKARLQAVHAAAEYSIVTRNNISISKSADWQSFREWTNKQPDKFGSFNTYATEKGI